MGHRIRKRTLEELLGIDVLKFSSRLQMSCYIRKRLMKMLNRRAEIRQERCPVATADEEGTCISEHAIHVLYQLVRRADLRGCAKSRKVRRRVSQCLLCPVRESSE